MRRLFTVLTVAFAVVSFSSMVSAQAATATQTQKPKVAAEQTAAKTQTVKVAKPVALSASGTVAKFDEATKTLTVTTKTGDKDFTLAADAKIMVGAKAAAAGDLMAGKKVKVTYATMDGKHVASKVTIAADKK